MAYVLGCAGVSLKALKTLLPMIGGTWLLGAMLAAPVLLNEVELFSHSVRAIYGNANAPHLLCALGSFTAVFPWCLGTFRTLDLGKFAGQTALGFHLFIGSAGFVLAMLGACLKAARPTYEQPKRVALLLFGFYLIILCTPLLRLCYTRCSALGVMGLIVLAAAGLSAVKDSPGSFRRSGWWLCAVTLSLVCAINFCALVIYPRLKPKVHQIVREREKTDYWLDSAPALRGFQVENLPAEVSFKNPETILAFLGLLSLSMMLVFPGWRSRSAPLLVLLALNLTPAVLFTRRFVPRQSLSLWRGLCEGGPEQKRVMGALGNTAFRLWDITAGLHDQLMPNALPHLYQVRAVHGYAALRPQNLYLLPQDEQQKWLPQIADWVYRSPKSSDGAAMFQRNETPGLARFQWRGAARRFSVAERRLDEVRITFDAGETGQLLWTDTHYPGWRAILDGCSVPLAKVNPCFSLIDVPVGGRELVLRYEPRLLRVGVALSLGGLAGCLGLGRVRIRSRLNP